VRSFDEIADRVYVLRYPVLDVNVTLVAGDGAALVVDTLSSDEQAGELLAAVRRVTPHPLVVVNTHHHFDHTFGNAALRADTPGCAIWAHEHVRWQLTERTPHRLPALYEEWRELEPELAAQLRDVVVVPPDQLVRDAATVLVGGRTVELAHHGRGHTAGDLVVRVPDADVLLAGDLVEEGADPSFDDAFPLEWADTVAAFLPRCTGAVVPGHGAVVDGAFARGQHERLAALDWAIREGYRDVQPAESVAKTVPFGAPGALIAVRRGYAELDGTT
jgi:glyoxylase-like metal-dependent hydrolase (beta-lactamase superfamily II)